ncbi:uncharacterized protein [Antedon mediterranea]|uniref:uncharacterized protein n=1 Tax=Antedon mediterranea TaxID=105859 RepID=UPI003AF6FCFD
MRQFCMKLKKWNRRVYKLCGIEMMAQAKSDISTSTLSIDSNTEDHRGRYCAICYHRFSCNGKAVPRILICGHSFCTACLEKLIGKVARGYVRCPSCKTDTIVSGFSNDVERLAKNFAVLEILEGLEDTGDKSSSNITNPVLVCNIHEREPKKVYCITDNEIICIYCQVYGEHEGHECQLISTAAEEGRQICKQLADEIMKEREKVTLSKKSIHDTVASIRFKEEKSMREITHHFEMLRRKLYRRENQIKGKLKNLSSSKVKSLEKQKKQLSDMIGRCDRLHASCQALISGPDYEILQQKAQMQIDCRETGEAVCSMEAKPCTQNDLSCLLDCTMADKISNHGIIIEDTEKANSSEGCQSGASSPRDPTTDESEGQEPENIEWFRLDNGRTRRTTNTPRSRRSIQPEDVMVLENDDTNVDSTRTEEVARPTTTGQSSNAATTTSTTVASTTRTTQRAMHSRSTSLRGSQLREALAIEEGGRNLGCHPFLRHCTIRDRRSYPYMPLPFSVAARENNSSTTESPDLSDISDMEIELPLRSAWPNAGNWAGQSNRDAGTTVSLSAREILSVMQDNPANNGNQTEGATAQSTSEEVSPVRRRCHQHSQKSSSGYTRELKCSVFNCATKSSTFFVKCKKCSRVFCRDCVAESASARRCYKRPQGHSFVYLAGSSQQSPTDGVPNQEESVEATHNSPDVLRALLSSETSYRCSRCAGNSHSCHRNHACSKCNSRSRPQQQSSDEPRSDGSGESSGHTGSDRTQTSTRNHVSEKTSNQRKTAKSSEGGHAKQKVCSSSSNSSISSHTESSQAVGGKNPAKEQTIKASAMAARQDRVWRTRRSLSPCENLCPSCSVSNSDDAVTCASCGALLLL